jgi:hypothetical protein
MLRISGRKPNLKEDSVWGTGMLANFLSAIFQAWFPRRIDDVILAAQTAYRRNQPETSSKEQTCRIGGVQTRLLLLSHARAGICRPGAA